MPTPSTRVAELRAITPMEGDLNSAKIEKLFTSADIQQRVKELAAEISNDFSEYELHIVGVLKGAFIFLADLVRFVTVPCFVHFIHAASYGNQKTSSGTVRIEQALDLKDKHILIVEDIVDTGLTLSQIVCEFKKQKPASLDICTLLDKPERREVVVDVQYTGFTIADYFVVGYGIDFAEQYRELPYIARLND